MRFGIDDIEWAIRPSQLTNVYGPGSLYDNLRDSVLILGSDYWDNRDFKTLSEPNLVNQIKKNNVYFKSLKYFVLTSPENEEEAYIPVKTFPTWGVCPACNLLQKRNGGLGKGAFECISKKCVNKAKKERSRSPDTFPVGIVVVCERGHLDDFPWYAWAHQGTRKKKCEKKKAELHLIKESESTAMDSQVVKCDYCGSEKDLGMALTKSGVSNVLGECRGKSPWISNEETECKQATPRGIFKGASNVYFPRSRSILTVPPFSDELSRDVSHRYEDLLKTYKKKPDLLGDFIEIHFDVKTDENPEGKYHLEEIKKKFFQHLEVDEKGGDKNLYEVEYKELNSGFSIENQLEFETQPIDVPEIYSDDLDKLVLVKKLRQIIAITGFTRLGSWEYGNTGSKLASLSEKPPVWLPATQNRGEGIFLSFKEPALERWLDKTVEERFKTYASSSNNKLIRKADDNPITARYVFLHSMSHLLMRGLAEFAGYSLSSIQERIYSGQDMAGILLFTSSPSSDGSLGGLVEQGTTEKFSTVMQKSVSRSKTCSADPMCSFYKPSVNGGNGAACHACLFVPEPSCENMNQGLDRAMIHSTLDKKVKGFFGT